MVEKSKSKANVPSTNSLDDEKYIIEGRIEVTGENVFFAMDKFKSSLVPGTTFRVTKAHVIKNDDFSIDVTEYFNQS